LINIASSYISSQVTYANSYMESIVERKTTRWQDRIHRRWFLIYDPIRFYAKERYIIEKIVKAIITVLPMEQKKRERWKSVCVFVKEGKKERRKERKRARSLGTDWPPLRTLLLFSFSVSVKRIPLSRAHEKEKKKKKKKKKKLRTNGRKGEKERRSVYFFMVAGMRASKGLPSAASFSISMRRATPSQTNWRSSTSE